MIDIAELACEHVSDDLDITTGELARIEEFCRLRGRKSEKQFASAYKECCARRKRGF